MIEFLVKRFIGSYSNVKDVRVKMAYGTPTSMMRISCNLLLFVSKLYIDVLVHSVSVTADVFNGLSDAASSIIGFVSVKMAEKPTDDDHPFGYGRIEYIVTFIVAFLVIQVGFSLFKTFFGRVLHLEDMNFQWISILILLMPVGIRLWLSCFNRKLGKHINSKVMLVTSADTLDDVTITSATMCSIGIYGAPGLNVDGIVGLIVSVVVMIVGVSMVRDTLTPPIGRVIDSEIYDRMTSFVGSSDGIVGSRDLIVHDYGPSRSMASIHIGASSDCNMERTHEIIDHIERKAVRRMGILLVTHMDPVETHSERVVEFKELVTSVLDSIDSRPTFHDFRMVGDTERINLIFDLVVPREYKLSILGKLKARITEDVAKKDRCCCCVITMESSFISEGRE